MRKTAIFFYLILFVSYLNATSHIKFMGIEVTGSYESFKDSLKAKGFTYMSSFENLHNFYSKFATEIVKLCIVSSTKSNTVFKVIVYFPAKDNWKELKRDYFTKKEMYKQKYPLDRDYEFFSSPYEDGDGYEMRAVIQDKCRYVSFFLAIGGHITVEIDKSAQIMVVYEDRENMKLGRNELLQEAIDDI